MQDIQDKEEYARRLARRAETGLKVIKALFLAVAVVAGACVVFALASMKMQTEARLTGLVVFACAAAVLLAAVAGTFIFTYITLGKLKKLR